MSNVEFRKLQNDLDKIGIATTIKKIDKKEFHLIVNFEIIKVRKQRVSCRNSIIKLHQQNFQNEII